MKVIDIIESRTKHMAFVLIHVELINMTFPLHYSRRIRDLLQD